MTPAAVVALIVAAVFAVGDWIACTRTQRSSSPSSVGWQRLEYVCKPGAMLALAVVAGTLDPTAGADARQRWFVAALLFSLAGDVFLMLPSDRFVAGLSAFFVAHCCYLAGFWTHGPALVPLLVSIVVTVIAVGVIATKVLGAVRRKEPELLGPVAAYILVIAAMLATALAVGNPIAAIGAVLFVISDSLIAWDRFVAKVPAASLLIMVAYHLGQAGLVLSLLK